ncbi:DUF5134 domain-containing protein [Streptomyces reniochalinae]|uniref:DUF5134 domain-containing protein n=1 Tax=Streptomyces reniochalinae TaxID=2250578 RepID=UPI00319EBAAF
MLAALCAVTGASCVLRARGAGHRQRADAGGEAAMGFGMAVMAVPLLWSVPPTVRSLLAWGFAAAFGALLAHGAWRATSSGRGDRARYGKRSWRGERVSDRDGRRSRHGGPRQHVHHLVGGAAILYMSVVMALGTAGASGSAHAASASPHSAHSAPGGVPVVTALLLAYFAMYALWTAARLMPAATDRGAAGVAGGREGGTVGVPAADLMRQAGIAAGCRLAMATGMFAMLITL